MSTRYYKGGQCSEQQCNIDVGVYYESNCPQISIKTSSPQVRKVNRFLEVDISLTNGRQVTTFAPKLRDKSPQAHRASHNEAALVLPLETSRKVVRTHNPSRTTLAAVEAYKKDTSVRWIDFRNKVVPVEGAYKHLVNVIARGDKAHLFMSSSMAGLIFAAPFFE